MSISTARSISADSPLFRPRRRPRVVRVRVGFLRFLLIALTLSLCALGYTWKNIEFKRVNINLARSRSTLAQLEKEQLQLSGEVKSLASYPRIANWAEKNQNWRIATHPPYKITIPRQDLTPAAQQRWDISRVRDE